MVVTARPRPVRRLKTVPPLNLMLWGEGGGLDSEDPGEQQRVDDVGQERQDGLRDGGAQEAPVPAALEEGDARGQ